VLFQHLARDDDPLHPVGPLANAHELVKPLTFRATNQPRSRDLNVIDFELLEVSCGIHLLSRSKLK
jgi:hypothetical protein